MSKQESFIELPAVESEQKDEPRTCLVHPWVMEKDFIEVIIKRSGKTVYRCIHCEQNKLENKKMRVADWEYEKKNLTDYYIRRCLVSGNKNSLPMHEYPQEMVDAFKAVRKLQRKVKEEKSEDPVKVCIWHGDLYIEDVVKRGKTVDGEQRYRCKHCMHKQQKTHYEMYKVKVQLKQREYKLNNRQKVLEIKRKSRLKNKHKYVKQKREYSQRYREMNLDKERNRDKISKREAREKLTDGIILKDLRRNTVLMSEDFSEEFIETIRAIKLLKRGVKKEQRELKLSKLEEKLNEQNK